MHFIDISDTTTTETHTMKPELTNTLTAFSNAFKTLKPLATASYATAKANAAPAITKSRNTTASLLEALANRIKA
jgi:hypothetical protein